MSTDADKQFGFVETVTAGLRRRSRVLPGLRMTAMIDVVFLLLTFFVLTVQFEKPEQALPLVFNPTRIIAQTEPLKPLELAILPAADGCSVQVAQNEKIVILQSAPEAGLAALAGQMRKTAADNQSRQVPIKLNCDDAVSWDLVTKIYDILYGLGARDITFVVEKK
jgi:biopolymer transport protein ExbD